MSEQNSQKYKAKSFAMNDDAALYQKSNCYPRRDAVDVLTEFLPKFKWKEGKKRIFDIGCADGSVTNIISAFCNNDYEVFEACDINERSVKYATEYYGTDKMIFRVMDIEGQLPKEMNGKFDNVFSFYTLQWIKNQEKAYQNIYDLMAKDGECLLTLLARIPVYSLFNALKDTDTWGYLLKDINQFISPYHDVSDPDVIIQSLLEKVGFQYVDVRCRQKKYEFKDIQQLRNILEAVSPFNVDKELYEQFFDDIMEVAEDMRIIDRRTKTATFHYNLIVIHCRK
ncbi:juvenile hormone acid O-methyltransferase-like [Bombyx mandarina]|uniref:Juvenile hormone acid O-methyltransferase-like n=1 Tax=Bombyx mandarina TaxID=7092 RepID=A0A6J2JR15_BOMMA|nr:juvenile hormone acid O-methyltransferase-like [Bombyx mandarina]